MCVTWYDYEKEQQFWELRKINAVQIYQTLSLAAVSLQQTSLLPFMCVRGCVHLLSAVPCVTELRIVHLLVVMCYSLFYHNHTDGADVLCCCLVSAWGSYTPVTLAYSNQCDQCDVCGLAANLLSALKPLSQHRKHSDAGKAYQKIYCGCTHFTA